MNHSDIKALDDTFVMPTYKRNDLQLVKGDNATLYNEKGEDFIDFVSGIAVISVGHANKQVNDAIKSQIDNLTHTSNLYLIEPQALLAKALDELVDGDYNTFFCNSGTEANEGAIKLARKYGEVDNETKRYKIITLKHSFHGRTITSLKATGQESMHNYFGPFPDGFTYADGIEDIPNHIDNQTVGVMIELIQGEGGVESLDKQAVQNLQKICNEKNILLIVDEVQTGIYRTGEPLASNLYGISPDIITLAKGLGNGLPIGAIMCRHKNLLTFGEHGSTFGGNFLCTRGALEVLSLLKTMKKEGRLAENIAYFDDKMRQLQKQFPHILKSMVGVGMMRGFRLDDDQLVSAIIEKCFNHRLLILKAGRNTLRLLPTMSITKQECDEGFIRFEKALGELG